MNKKEFGNGHPRTRGARSAFEGEKSSGEYLLEFGTVKSFDGTPIFYCVESPVKFPNAQPLVFSYGFACSPLHWTYQIDYFRKNFKCIWIDYRGHRRTPMPEKVESITIESITKDINSVLDFLNIPSAVLLGHSMGVNVVLDFALRYPEKTQGLVLANGTPRKPLETIFGNNMILPHAFQMLLKMKNISPKIVEQAWMAKGKSDFFSFMLGILGFNRKLSHADDIRAYADQIVSFNPIVMTTLMADYEKSDSTPHLHKIKKPTLILSGMQDYITPPHTQELTHQLIPHSDFVRVRHGSHCTPIDLPELVNLEIEKFIRGKVL